MFPVSDVVSDVEDGGERGVAAAVVEGVECEVEDVEGGVGFGDCYYGGGGCVGGGVGDWVWGCAVEVCWARGGRGVGGGGEVDVFSGVGVWDCVELVEVGECEWIWVGSWGERCEVEVWGCIGDVSRDIGWHV